MCRADRLDGRGGFCNQSYVCRVASWNIHTDEEPPISGTRGSGTVFFTGCNLKCSFCQNFPLSHYDVGNETSVEELAGKMIQLQKRGAHNINFVTGTHFIPVVIAAVEIARSMGLTLPIVWNTSSYERVETLRLLDGYVSIYLADFKFSSSDVARRLAGAENYPLVARNSILEMVRQVGGLKLSPEGIAVRGVVVRHLVLPSLISMTKEIIDFVARNLPEDVAFSLMSQYTPYYKVVRDDSLGRRLTEEEYEEAVSYLLASGIKNGWIQDMSQASNFAPPESSGDGAG